jgi:hypothetical protein
MFLQFFDFEGEGGVGGQPGKGTHDRVVGSESKSSVFGSFCTRQLVRVSQRVRTGHFCGSIAGKNGSDRSTAGRGLRPAYERLFFTVESAECPWQRL